MKKGLKQENLLIHLKVRLEKRERDKRTEKTDDKLQRQ